MLLTKATAHTGQVLMDDEVCDTLDTLAGQFLNQPEEWKDREREGVLYVPKAGEILYRLKH